MFTRIHFTSEAIDDVRELVSLTDVQLEKLAGLLNSKEATPPVEPEFIKTVEATLDLGSKNAAESVTRLVTILQSEDLNASQAAEVVGDMITLVKEELNDSKELLEGIGGKSNALAKVIERQPEISRQLKLKRMAAGTQPAIENIRTLVQLRPFFERDVSTNEPKSIECMVPAMTLELSFKKNERSQSATFSLDEEALNSLIENLQHARLKWQMLNKQFSEQVCK